MAGNTNESKKKSEGENANDRAKTHKLDLDDLSNIAAGGGQKTIKVKIDDDDESRKKSRYF
ncbi:MAG: hypothetical protein VYC34_08520 [Planctomycetota bacterium]|nr:hypothetical protein [Planctomycetota bacterium]